MLPPFTWCFNNTVDEYAGYAVVSEYFGRGLFNKLTLVTEPPGPGQSPEEPQTAQPAPVPASAAAPALPVKSYGPGAEAKLRLQEGQSKQVFVPNTAKQVAPKGTAVIPVPEGRMRVLEQQRYSSSLEANLNKLEPRVHAPRTSPLASPNPGRKRDDQPTSTGVSVSPKISSAITNQSKNPFETENYDETKNPFADEEATEPTNPFAEDDYDKNLNPFS